MFNINKSPFSGTNTTSPFFTSTPSRFGENFPKPSTPNFGEFNKPMPPNFGSTPFATNTNAPAFNPFGSTSNNQMLFGQQQTNEIFGNQFGQQEKSTFNFTPKTTGFIFGQPQTNVFKPQSSTGIFPSSSFCAPSVPPGTVVKFVPVKLTDTAIIKGINQTINGRNQCITCMKEYEDKSLEELRWEDYQANRNKGPQDLFFNSPNNSNIEPMSMESPTAPINMFPSQESNLNKNLFGYKFGTVTTSSNTPIGLFGKPIFGFGNSTKPQTSQNQNFFGANTNQLFNQPQQTNFNQATTSNIFNIRNTPFINTNSNTNSPQNNALFPGLNTNTTFSFGNSPVVTSTAVIGQSTFGQNLFNTNSLFKPSINTPSNIFTNTPNNTNTYKSAFPSLVNHASNNTVFKYNPPQNIFPNHQVQQSTNQFTFTPNQNQNYHEQILSMSSNPYGLSDLLNNIKEIDNNIKDSTRATNPNELSTLLKTVKPDTKTKDSNEKLQPVHIFRKADQSMFDGLETGESTHAQRNPKKLVLRKYSFINNNEEVVCSDLNRIFENMNKSCIHPPEPKIEAVTTVSASTQVEQDIMQHPTGIILTRPEYYTVPALEELNDYINDEDGSCIVQGFTVGRLGYGNVYFPEAFDVSNLNLDELVHFCYKEVTIYPDDEKKPPRGEGLNRKAQITLDKVWPYDKKTNMLITDVDVLTEMDYADRLRRLCDRQQTKFVDYRPDTGSWVFRVDHFSKYGDQEDEDLESQDTEEYLNLGICGDFSKCALMKSTFFDDIQEETIIPDEVCTTETEIPLFEDDVLVEQNVEIDLPYMLPFKKSYFNYYKIYCDVAAFKSRSFKIGWGKNLQFLTLKNKNNIFGNAIQINEINTYSDNVLEKCLEDHLNKQLSNSQLNFNNVRNVANFSSRLGFSLLQEQNKVCCQNSFESDIWRLCNALWGQIQQFEILDERTIRKKLLSTWLQGTIAKEAAFNYNDGVHKTILKYLSLYEIEAAAKYAFQQNNLNLSLLISQLSSNGTIRNYLLNQLNVWKDMTELIDHDLLKIYLLLAGIPRLEFSHREVCFYEDMNWLQVLGCYLWYITNPEETISRGINLYDYTFPNEKRDLRFEIMKYYADNKHPITNILNPLMHTVNILDYRLSWFLLQILQSLRHCEINPRTKLFVHLNFACQLEQLKLWHWAVFVLLFLEDVNLKASLIQDVIGRNVEIINCTTEYTKREHFLIHKLRIPAKWLENAKATLAKHLGKTQQAISYLCYAEKWLEAYNLLMELLMPNHYFSYDYEFLNKILTPLSFHKNLLPNWEEGGGLILDFARLGIEYNASSLQEDNGRMFRSESIRFRSSVVNIHARIRDISDLSYIRHVCAAGIAGRSWSVLDHLFN